MYVASTIVDLRAAVRELRAVGRTIAFVPTMGALHEGHLTLMDEARRRADAVLVSIFVNPLQFAPTEDLATYPRTLEADLTLLRARGVAGVFTPTVDEMYASGRVISVTAAPHETGFEADVRPGHFTGVLTVVAKLFNIVQPDVAVFGQKDLQQLSFVRRMVGELNFPIEIVGVPTVREPDGLAMSSRNRYLSPTERLRAGRLSQALRAARAAFEAGERSAQHLQDVAARVLADDPAITVDYLDVVDPVSFARVDAAGAGDAVILAARVGATRLLDNVIL
jgi:pantoate--beta-alanine ligase